MAGIILLVVVAKCLNAKEVSDERITDSGSSINLAVSDHIRLGVGTRSYARDSGTFEKEKVRNEKTAFVSAGDTGGDPVQEAPTKISFASAEEAADYVLNHGINGPDREAFLGDRYDEVQAYIDANFVPPHEDELMDYPTTGNVLNPYDGINYYGGVLETYYDLDMSWCIGVMRDMGYDEVNYPYWIRSDGVKMLGDYVMCAADFDYEPRGTFTMTSLGPAIVVDTGLGGWGWHDIAVAW